MTTRSSHCWPWFMLISRIGLFIGIQAIFALGFFLTGLLNAWENSANWWQFVMTITNFICVALMIHLFHQDGKNFWNIFHLDEEHIKSDLLVRVGLIILVGPVSYVPNILLGSYPFGDPLRALDLLLRPLPLWAAYASIVMFPVTQGIAELSTYFGYVMPELESQGLRSWMAITISIFMLGIQHIDVPFLFHPSYLVWRGLIFIPFAFLLGIVLHWRPRLLPYLASSMC